LDTDYTDGTEPHGWNNVPSAILPLSC